MKKDNDIQFIEVNKHQKHEVMMQTQELEKNNVRTEKENMNLTTNLIKNNITEDLEFHYNNLFKNKI